MKALRASSFLFRDAAQPVLDIRSTSQSPRPEEVPIPSEPVKDDRRERQAVFRDARLWRLLIYVVYPLVAGVLLFAALR